MNITFVFPGQGSQYVGMGLKMSEKYSAARDILKKASEVLNFPLAQLCFDGPAEELQKTENAQPAILAVSIACFMALREKGIQPSGVAGHSLGEYSALVAAGALSFEDALFLVRKRGQYMQEAAPPGEGGMVAVLGLNEEKVREICREISDNGDQLDVANYNCPGQVVIAGVTGALEKASRLLKAAGAKKCVGLSVSAPFHSRLMRPAAERLALHLNAVEISNPGLPFVANVTAEYVQEGKKIRDLLVKQVYSPVCWEQSIQLLASNTDVFLEVGPGTVLTGLIKKINRQAITGNVEDPDSLEKVLARLGEVG
jgi:[acyl-carrier-protein] S-malonyltransferase